MYLRTAATTFMLLLAAAGAATAQTPAISSIWDDTRLSQRECNARAEQVMRNSGFTRIETIGQTTFGDRPNYQIGLRCLSDKGLYYIYGGGPREAELRKYIDDLKANFNR
jgi:hypothetical protein